METYTYYLTIEVHGMNEESAENKLEKFLASLDLKKNHHLNLTGVDVEEGEEEIDMSDDPAPTKKKRPAIKLPKNPATDWDDELDDVDWDTLDEEETPEPKPKAQPVEEEDWDWDEDDWDEDSDEDSDEEDEDDEDISTMLAGLDD
jgi:hypothetical protein